MTMSRPMSKSQQKRFAVQRKKPEGAKQRTPRPPYDGDHDYNVIERGVEEYYRRQNND